MRLGLAPVLLVAGLLIGALVLGQYLAEALQRFLEAI